jgi:hypothetical protein
MHKYFTIYAEVVSHVTLHPIPMNFLIYEENFLFFFISVEVFRAGGAIEDLFAVYMMALYIQSRIQDSVIC